MSRVATSLLFLTTIMISNSCEAQRARRGASPDRKTLRVAGRERGYVVRVPAAVATGSTRAPLVIVLHGGGGNAGNAESMTGFTAKANADCARTAPNVDHGRYLVVPYRWPSSLGVESYTIKDGAHAWPGGQKGSRMGAAPSTAIRATDVIWTFFAQHPKQ